MSSGNSPRNHFGARLEEVEVDCSMFRSLAHYLKKTHPTKFGELRLVCMEHIASGREVGERELYDATLGLTLHDCIDCG